MLHVWLRAQHSPLAVWHEESKQWQLVDNWQQLYEVYGNNSKNLCLYFPSTHILQVESELNANQLKQLGVSGKQYLFEETSLTAVEQLAVKQISQLNTQQLYALPQSDIEAWQRSATLVGLNIVALLPDFLLVAPPEEGAGQQVTLYQDKHTMLMRQSFLQGMAVSYLPLMFERLSNLSEVCVLAPIDDDLDNDSANQASIDDATATLIAEQQLLLTTLSSIPMPIAHPEREVLNFYTKSSDSKLSPYLRVAMMVALSALVLQMATDGLQVYRYNAANAATEEAISAQYQSWFPNERLNPRTKLQMQMSAKLRADSQSSAHMAALKRISPLIKQSALQAQSLEMQPSALSFILTAPNRDSLDSFLNTLTTQGMTAKLERVNGNEQGTFTGQMTVNIQDNSESQAVAMNDATATS